MKKSKTVAEQISQHIDEMESIHPAIKKHFKDMIETYYVPREKEQMRLAFLQGEIYAMYEIDLERGNSKHWDEIPDDFYWFYKNKFEDQEIAELQSEENK